MQQTQNKTRLLENFTLLTPVLIGLFLITSISIWALGYANNIFYFLYGFISAIIIIKVIPKYTTKIIIRRM